MSSVQRLTTVEQIWHLILLANLRSQLVQSKVPMF